jgi:hypothetical protein
VARLGGPGRENYGIYVAYMKKGVPKGARGGGVGVGEVLNPAHAATAHGREQQKAAAGSSRRNSKRLEQSTSWVERKSRAARGHNSHSQTQPN